MFQIARDTRLLADVWSGRVEQRATAFGKQRVHGTKTGPATLGNLRAEDGYEVFELDF